MHNDLSESINLATGLTILASIATIILIVLTVMMSFSRIMLFQLSQASSLDAVDQLVELEELNREIPLATLYARIESASVDIHLSSEIPSIPVTDMDTLKNHFKDKAKIQVSSVSGEYYVKLVE